MRKLNRDFRYQLVSPLGPELRVQLDIRLEAPLIAEVDRELNDACWEALMPRRRLGGVRSEKL